MNEQDNVVVTKEELKSSNVFLEEPHTMNRLVYLLKNLWEFVYKIIYWLVDLVFSMFSSLWHFLKLGVIGLGKGVVGIYKFFQRKCHQFKYNNLSGRLSFIVFGSSSFSHKQYVNGVLFLLFEVLYIVFFAMFGVSAIGMLGTLGVVQSGPDPDCMDDFCDWVNGDNSIMILIYGLLWVLSIILFVYIWNRNINSGYNNYRIDKFIEFDEITKKNQEMGLKIDSEVVEEFKNGTKKSAYKKMKVEEIEQHLSQFTDKKEHDYSHYLVYNSISYVYEYQRKLKRLHSRLDKLSARRDKALTYANNNLEKVIADVEEKKALNPDDYDYIDKLNVKVEKTRHALTSKQNKWNKIVKDQEHKIYEFEKTHANYVSVQNVRNNNKYGKFNDYYNRIGKLNVELTFFKNYRELLKVYQDNLDKNEDVNHHNEEEIKNLEVLMNQKIEKTKEKYNKIRERRAEIEAQLEEVKNTYKQTCKEVKQSKPSNGEELLVEAKTKLIEDTTRLRRILNDLPSSKNVDLLEKEEISESKQAYKRDKKYLKTNYTSESYALECVNNKMIVDYKLDFDDASAYISKYLNSKKKLEMDEVDERISQLEMEREEFISKYPNKYVGRPRSFKESISGLFNENFHITILFIPVAGILLFTIVPLLFSILIAFTNYSVGHIPPQQLFTWIGWENFKNLLFPDANSVYAVLPDALLQTVGWTFTWAIFATFTNYILGIVVALLINKDGIKLKRLWRTIFILTIAIPQFISLLSIGTLLKDTGAIGNLYFEMFNQRLGFGTDSSAQGVLMAKIIIIVVNIWVGIPYTILSTTGILLNIPKDLYESARVDGAGTFTQFVKITMPYILFVTGPYLITQFIGNINNFNVIFFLTGGGPSIAGSGLLGLGQTDLLITFLYKIITSTNNPQYGIASSVGIIIFIICSFISIVMYNKSGAIKEEDQFQ